LNIGASFATVQGVVGPSRIGLVSLCAGILLAVSACVPDTQDTPLAHALLKTANNSAWLAIGKQWCDDCTVSVTDARRSPADPQVAAATIHIAFNQEGDETHLVFFAKRGGGWRVLHGTNARGCTRLARMDRVPLRALTSLGVCDGGR
jgi:hypothetical protein